MAALEKTLGLTAKEIQSIISLPESQKYFEKKYLNRTVRYALYTALTLKFDALKEKLTIIYSKN